MILFKIFPEDLFREWNKKKHHALFEYFKKPTLWVLLGICSIKKVPAPCTEWMFYRILGKSRQIQVFESVWTGILNFRQNAFLLQTIWKDCNYHQIPLPGKISFDPVRPKYYVKDLELRVMIQRIWKYCIIIFLQLHY